MKLKLTAQEGRILELLGNGQSYGAELVRRDDSGVLTPGPMSGRMRRMREKGLIQSIRLPADGTKSWHRVTSLGEEILEEWLRDVAAVRRKPSRRGTCGREGAPADDAQTTVENWTEGSES